MKGLNRRGIRKVYAKKHFQKKIHVDLFTITPSENNSLSSVKYFKNLSRFICPVYLLCYHHLKLYSFYFSGTRFQKQNHKKLQQRQVSKILPILQTFTKFNKLNSILRLYFVVC